MWVGDSFTTSARYRDRIEHAFDMSWADDLDAAAACEAVVTNRDELRERAWRELALGDPVGGVRHGPESLSSSERLAQRAGEGTPEVAEFACAELGLLLGVGFIAAGNLIRDAIDLQHRHPLMWALLGDGRGQVWKARQVARLAHAAWQLRQPTPGVYLWRTRLGYWFRVDHDGTHTLGRDPDLTVYDPPPSRSGLERIFADLVLGA